MAGDLMPAAIQSPVWSEFPTPLGRLVAIGSPSGISRLGFSDDDPVAAVEDETGLRIPRDAAALRDLREQVQAYFEGTLRSFSVAPDLGAIEGFARQVLEQARRVPFGSVATYGELAARAGSPRAGRAAGSAMRRNPVQLLVPCHRVVPADGSIGGYSGREDRKAFLLDHEAAALGQDAGLPGSAGRGR
ncbi:MAG: methylated-DNA--[protein]-cysteine S-methyltransferase [Actinomycetota bacterium]